MLYRDRAIVYDAARFLADTAMTMNPVAMCVPTNLSFIDKDWKTCAKAGHFPNPKFQYDKDELRRIALLGIKISGYWTQVRLNCKAQNDIDDAILKILEGRVCDALLTAEIAASILDEDDARTQEAIIGLYGNPTGSLIANAYDSIAHPTIRREGHRSRFSDAKLAELEAMKFNAADIRKQFISVFNYYGFRPAWECIIDERISNAIDARDKTATGKSQLVIPAKKTVDGRALASLIGHEIESHIRGSENSRALFRQLLGENSPLLSTVPLLAKSDDERFYEGVAKMSDVATNGDKSLPHPYYTIAIHRAESGESFGDIAQVIYMLKHDGSTSEDDAANFAWNVTRRVFRGCTDTSIGFANTKDYGYFAGYEMAKRVPASYRDYSSMTISNLQLLEEAGVNLESPRYPYKDAVEFIFGE